MAFKVRATRPGVYIHYREAGEEFLVPEGTKLGTWMERVDAPIQHAPLKDDPADVPVEPDSGPEPPSDVEPDYYDPAQIKPVIEAPSAPAQASQPIRPLIEAVQMLDPADDSHWTKAGLPSVEAVHGFFGAECTRADINDVAPDMVRPVTG